MLGHLQRAGTPTASDRLLATQFGVHAATLCAERRFGRMVTLRSGRIESVTFEEACAESAFVDVAGELASCARMLGIELGGPVSGTAVAF